MELLLNLIWVAIALSGFAALAVGRRRSANWITPVPLAIGLCVVACVAVILFPVISASDDMHPTPTLIEDAGKRAKLVVASLHSSGAHVFSLLFSVVLSFCLFFSLKRLACTSVFLCISNPLQRPRTPGEGRAPPSYF